MTNKIPLTPERKEILMQKGIETLFVQPGKMYPSDLFLEPPMSIKWVNIQYQARIHAFSYFVSGFCMATEIGRYCSIGEDVQIGRQDHPLDWVSTHPFQYMSEKIFALGNEFDDAEKYHSYKSHLVGVVAGTAYPPVRTRIGHDVWIGHGAFIRAGVNIGNGAVIAAESVVVKDVEPYTIVGGNPASLIRPRFSEKVIASMQKSEWWRFAPWQLKGLSFNNPEKFLDELVDLTRGVEPYTPSIIRLGDIFP